MSTIAYPCPCCGFEVFAEPPGSYDICPICFWEVDLVQLVFPDMAGGANSCSLIEAQQAYAKSGVSEVQFRSNVRTPRPSEVRHTGWRMLEPQRDLYLHWSHQDDHTLWEAVKDASGICLYYWSPKYWRLLHRV